MRQLHPPIAAFALFAGLTLQGIRPEAAAQDVKEQSIGAPDGVAITVRMEGPYTADAPLQVVCYFKYTPDRAKRMTGAPVELDKELGGVIAALRERSEFTGAELETLLLIPPRGSIKAKALLLIGLGEEDSLSLARMERVGRVALREASRLGVRRVAFAPLLRKKRPPCPAEPLVGAMRAGIRFVLHAPAFQAVLDRAAAFVVGGSSLL